MLKGYTSYTCEKNLNGFFFFFFYHQSYKLYKNINIFIGLPFQIFYFI